MVRPLSSFIMEVMIPIGSNFDNINFVLYAHKKIVLTIKFRTYKIFVAYVFLLLIISLLLNENLN